MSPVVTTLLLGVAASLIAAAIGLGLRSVFGKSGPFPTLLAGREAVYLSRPAPGRPPDRGPPLCLDPSDASLKASLRWGGPPGGPDIVPQTVVARFEQGHDRAVWIASEQGATRHAFVNDQKEFVISFDSPGWQPDVVGGQSGQIVARYRLSGSRRLHHCAVAFRPAGARMLTTSSRETYVWTYGAETPVRRLRYLMARWT